MTENIANTDATDAFSPGKQVTVTWEKNTTGSVKSNRINGERTNKIVLPTPATGGLAPQPGESWDCVVLKITNPKALHRGAIIVQPLRKRIDADFGHVWVEEKNLEVMIAVLQDPTKNLFLEGMQGVGKTTIAEAAARQLGMEFRVVDGSQIKKAATMYGRPQQRATEDGHLVWGFADSALIICVREALAHPEKNFLLFIDEYTRIDLDARDGFLKALEGKERAFTTPRPETVPVPSNLYWIAAGNVGDSFTVQDQDAANMDRWVVVEVNRMPYEVEIKHLLRKYPTCPREELEKALTVVHQLIELVSTNQYSNTISVRQTEAMAMLLAAGGISTQTAIVTAIANQFPGRSSVKTSQRGRLIAKIGEALNNVKN